MSKERQRRRAIAEAERRKKSSKAKRDAAVQKKVTPRDAKRPGVYRQRRFPPLPWRLKVALALLWLTAAVLVFVFVPTWTARIGFLVIATMMLPLIVVIVRDPTRRTRR